LSETYVAGTVPIFTEGLDSEKFFHALLLYGPDGKVHGRYDRQHLFNGEGSTSLGVLGAERCSVEPGVNAGMPQVISTPVGKIGLSIGFDVRFPQFFQQLRQQGAEVILIPSSCAYALADAHWHILVGARAIENQAFIIAANQSGLHDNQQESYGESMILGPWGDVLNYQEHGVGPVVSTVDLLHLEILREDFPVCFLETSVG
jgi:predicted amidohydrolase